LAKKIERLYISTDRPSGKGAWQKAISKYCLGGYHILAGVALVDDIKRQLNIAEGAPFMIPRYLLVNSKGTITIPEVVSPLNFAAFEEQIEKALN
jgi:hypothetical protein